MYEQIVRPVLDKVGHSEQAHHFVRDFLSWSQSSPINLKGLELAALGGSRFKSPRLENNFGGVRRENTTQLGAGWDKYGTAQKAWHILGDGATVIGGITADEQAANKDVVRQIVTKDEDDRYCSINNYGLGNNGGEKTAYVATQYLNRDWPIFLNAAFNKKTESLKDMPQDYTRVIEAFFPKVDGHRLRLVDGVQILVSCPNLHGPDFVHKLHDRSFLEDTSQAVKGTMLQLLGYVLPTDIKVGGDATLDELLTVMRVCSDNGFGMVGLNTSGNRNFKDHFGVANIPGGFSGDYPPYRNRCNEAAALIFNESGGKIYFTGAGGNYTGPDAWERHLAGAHIIEDVFGRRIHGPSTSNGKNIFIDTVLESEGVAHISEVIGRAAPRYAEKGYPNIPRE